MFFLLEITQFQSPSFSPVWGWWNRLYESVCWRASPNSRSFTHVTCLRVFVSASFNSCPTQHAEISKETFLLSYNTLLVNCKRSTVTTQEVTQCSCFLFQGEHLQSSQDLRLSTVQSVIDIIQGPDTDHSLDYIMAALSDSLSILQNSRKIISRGQLLLHCYIISIFMPYICSC